MLGLRRLSLLLAASCMLSMTPVALAQDVNVQALASSAPASRNLRVQHNGEDHGTGAGVGTGGLTNQQTGTKNPGGILGPLYAAFPGLLAPLAMVSDTIHNTNAALTGVQHTPDGIFQA